MTSCACLSRLVALEGEVEELRARVVELETVRIRALEEYDLPLVEGETPLPPDPDEAA
ncbi:MAG: hypothetical protein IPG04_17395 [Polyangiaceae bacterium]|nr:hypothetical protein [Polyangiaceae bacterium]